MEITTETKNHVVIFKDKSKKWINDKVFETLFTLENNGKFSVDGGIYDYNMVSKVLSRKEYYEEYPEDRPQVIKEFEPSKPVKLNAKKRQLILDGIEDAVGKNEFYKNIKELIAKKDYLKINELIN